MDYNLKKCAGFVKRSAQGLPSKAPPVDGHEAVCLSAPRRATPEPKPLAILPHVLALHGYIYFFLIHIISDINPAEPTQPTLPPAWANPWLV